MKNKDFSKKIIRHGEITLKPLDCLPTEAILDNTNVKDYVAAHSESGHHHTIGLADVFTIPATDENPIRKFLRINTDTQIKHLKSGKSAHKTLTVFKGFYEVVAKFAYNPFKQLREQVRD